MGNSLKIVLDKEYILYIMIYIQYILFCCIKEQNTLGKPYEQRADG
ncbi:hypothetical protein BRYFOR_06979 [Marvinbryantia formatexigens DSM 14469]|uniref:Uncharacterized protein n=1 Tax=Marvinbryantia formatexigens DSM 14469 TaxID=478749 RepID=C6LED0_9FIRM|nr:hypothetical protein BRYFOR_06979 [Marvinbryantia formatexigens DSM 14469]